MKPATIKQDGKVWRLWKRGTFPKDIVHALNVTLAQVYKGIYREKRRLGIPLHDGKGRPGKYGKIREKHA